jgi:hypothetical protein
LVLLDFETAKATDFNPLIMKESLADAVKEGVNDNRGFINGNGVFICQRLDKFAFIHGSLRLHVKMDKRNYLIHITVYLKSMLLSRKKTEFDNPFYYEQSALERPALRRAKSACSHLSRQGFVRKFLQSGYTALTGRALA